MIRCVRGETPLDLAKKRNQRKCAQVIERYQPPAPLLVAANWLHKAVDRYVRLLDNQSVNLKQRCANLLQAGQFLFAG